MVSCNSLATVTRFLYVPQRCFLGPSKLLRLSLAEIVVKFR